MIYPDAASKFSFAIFVERSDISTANKKLISPFCVAYFEQSLNVRENMVLIKPKEFYIKVFP